MNRKNPMQPTDGDDEITGTRGRDEIAALAGNDVVRGKGGADTLRGDSGDDALFGNGGNDKLFGGADNDRLVGGGGKDKLVGGSGSDKLKGGGARDKLIGGADDDTLTGGAGNDLFIFKSLSDGIDTIVDFDLAEGDALNLRKLLIGLDEAAPEDVVRLRSEGGDTIVAVSPDAEGDFTDLVRLKGQTLDLQDLLDADAIRGLPDDPAPELENRAPVVDQGIGNRIANEGQPYTFDLSSDVPADAFSDLDGDPLTYSVGNPGQLDWMSLDGDVLSGTPGPYSGPVLVELRATDPAGETAETTLRVNLETKRLQKSDEAQGQTEGTENSGDEHPTVGAPIISGDGRFVTFFSEFDLDRPQAELNSTRATYEPYVYDFAEGGGLIRLSTFFDLPDLPGGQTRSVDISDRGQYVVLSTTTALSDSDGNNNHDIYRLDLADPDAPPLLISVDDAGGALGPTPVAGAARAAVEHQVAISDDGQTIAFTSVDATVEVYRAQVDGGAAELIDSFGADNLDFTHIDLSGDGRVLAVATSDSFGDTTSIRVYERDDADPVVIEGGASPSLSDDGDTLAFARDGNVFVRGPDDASDVPVGFDETNSSFLLSATPYLSGDGTTIAFAASNDASYLSPGFSDDSSAFVRDLVTDEVREIPPLPGDEAAFLPSLSDDGEFISYLSFVDSGDSGETDTNVETVTHRFVDALPLYTPPPDLGVDDPVIGLSEIDLSSIVVDAPEVIV